MQNRKLLVVFFTCCTFKQVASGKSPVNTVNKHNLTEINLCVLCAYNKNEKSISSEVLQYFKDSRNHTTVKRQCYEEGDNHEVIHHYARNTFPTSYISILSPSSERKICYFNVTYYNVSQQTFNFDDTVYVEYGTETPSKSGKWNVSSRGKPFGKKILYEFQY